MLEPERKLYNDRTFDGNLARTWEKRIRQVGWPAPRRQGRFRLNARAETVYWIALMWLAAVAVTWAAVYVMQLGYRIDAMATEYRHMLRQQQAMGLQISQLTAPARLQQEAARLHVVLSAPKLAGMLRRPPTLPSAAVGWPGWVAKLFHGVRTALTGR